MSLIRKPNSGVPHKAVDINPLLVGDILPDGNFIDSHGKKVELKDIIKKKPTVFVFYRGGWCPYCNLQLMGLSKIENQIKEKGFQIVAISPDDYLNLNQDDREGEFKYELLSDPDGNYIKQIGIAFKTSLILKAYIVSKSQKGSISKVIPAPSVFVVDKMGNIVFEYIDPNYKERMDEKLLLETLDTIKIN